MLAGFATLQSPPVSHEELCSRLEANLLDLSDLDLPVRLLKDAEALLGNLLAAERATVTRSSPPALYRAIETLSRLTAIRRTLIGLAKALMEPPRPPASKPEPNKPAQATPSSNAPTLASPDTTASTLDDPAGSSFVVPPSGDPGDCEEPTGCGIRETAPANPTDLDPDQIARPIGLPKLSLTAVLSPQLSPSEKAQWAFETALHIPPLDAPAPSLGGAPRPTPQPKRSRLVRSSAEIVGHVRSCPRLATLSQKMLIRNYQLTMDLGFALKIVRNAHTPGFPVPAPPGTPRQSLTALGFSLHPMPPADPPASTAAPPDSG